MWSSFAIFYLFLSFSLVQSVSFCVIVDLRIVGFSAVAEAVALVLICRRRGSSRRLAVAEAIGIDFICLLVVAIMEVFCRWFLRRRGDHCVCLRSPSSWLILIVSPVSTITEAVGSSLLSYIDFICSNSMLSIRLEFEGGLQPLQPLPTKVTKVEVVVTKHGQQQQALNAAISRVETTKSAPRAGRSPACGHRGTTDGDEEEPGNDFIATAHKLEFP
ncbi:hypothetical protein GUJ93_ZPchr0363g33406 [Zizania palustris]|uniref:Uncharacterized protein n=1 Tax=Zizania palustris TaxID=103762 RepID=A0A8J6C0P3_ZIZPA|nr:hypothetical protein GUJ93_ZPchr0363g33406 [Zizania palustris]